MGFEVKVTIVTKLELDSENDLNFYTIEQTNPYFWLSSAESWVQAALETLAQYPQLVTMQRAGVPCSWTIKDTASDQYITIPENYRLPLSTKD